MKKFVEIFIKKPVTICTLTILIMIAGILGVMGMPVNLMPNMNMPFVAVSVIYPGASANEVEEQVTKKLESSIRTTAGIVEMTTNSYDNASALVIKFDYGTDVDAKIEEMENKLSLVTFPDDCYEPIFATVDFNAMAVAKVSVFRNDGNIDQLVEDTKAIQDLFYSIEGVGQVNVTGLPETKIELKSLEGLDISVMVVAQELMNGNLDIPLGSIIVDGENASIKNESSAKSIEELKKLPVKLEFNASAWTLLESFNDMLIEYEDSTTQEIIDQTNNLKDARDYINEIDGKTATEVEEIADGLSGVRSIMELVRNNTDVTLKMMWNQVIYPLSSDPDFLAASDEDLEKMAEQYDMSHELLKTLQKYAKDGTLEDKWNIIVNFRKTYPDEVTYEQFANLFIDLEFFEDYDPSSPTADEDFKDITKGVELADTINVIAFNDIIEAKENNEEVTNDMYAALFIGSDYAEESPLLVSGETIGIIRQDSFDANCQALIDYKDSHLDTEGNPRKLTDEEFMELYNKLIFEEELSLTPTLDLIHLIRNLDYEAVQYTSDGESGYLPVKLEDLCKVYYKTSYSDHAEFNGSFSTIISIYNKSGANSTATVEGVKEIMAESELTSTFFLLDDQSEYINESINNVLSSMLIGGLLAIAIIFVFIKKIGTSLVIGITMPLSVLASLASLYFMGTSLNMVSLGGLAVGIGMLVDNSIVVIEAITKKRESGMTLVKSAIEGTAEVGGSLLASTLTNIVVFFPILFSSGLTKEIFTDLTWAVIFSISYSLIVAITVIPSLYCLVYRKDMKKEEKTGVSTVKPIEKKPSVLVEKLESLYEKLLRKALKRKGLVVISALVIFILSVSMVFMTGIEFLPPADKHLLEVNITYENNYTLEEAHADTLKCRDIINQNVEDIEFVAVQVSGGSILSTNCNSTITVQLKETAKETEDVAQDIRELLDFNTNKLEVTQIDGIVASVTSGLMSGISVTLLGDNLDTLKEIADEAKVELMKVKGISSVYDNATAKSNEYVIHIDRDLCAEYNIDYTTLVAMLRVGIAGQDIATITLNDADEATNINVQFNDSTLTNIDTIKDIVVGINDEGAIKLKDIAQVELHQRRASITKENGKYVLTISVQTHGLDMGAASDVIEETINPLLKKHKGYEFKESGVNSYLTEAFDGLVVVLIASFILLFAVMACQFESLLKPFIVIMSIPLSFTGSFVSILISGTTLNVVSFIGIIMLMGVIVNDAIVMIDKIDLMISEGHTPYEAVVKGAPERIRAILMTSLTTILALIPLALGMGDGGELMQPLGIVVMGGLTLGTVVTLFLIPSFYCIIKRVKTRKVAEK